MSRQRHSALSRSLLCASWVPLGLALAAPSTALAQGAGLSFPQQGIVCDPRGQICYDQQGISMGLTRQYYGKRAERDLMAQFSSQPLPQEYRLSDGSVCSVNARTCWSDGWRKRLINQLLTAQQYGSGDQVISKDRGYCRLTNLGMQVYSGRCRLIRSTGHPAFRGSTYTVRMGPQLEVSFGHRRAYLEANSNGRFWPAQFQDLGNANALFRWGAQQLVVNTAVDGGTPAPIGPVPTPYPGTYSGNGLDWNGAIEGLLNGLFRP